MTENKKLSSQLMVIPNINTLLVTRATELLKQEVQRWSIEVCHGLPSALIKTSNNNRVVVTFVDRKHSEAMTRLKKSIG